VSFEGINVNPMFLSGHLKKTNQNDEKSYEIMTTGEKE
jgi:hypothetical protein